MNILFIPRWYPNRVDSLNGIFIKRHALAVAKMHRVAVLYVNADPNLKDKSFDIESGLEDGIEVVRVYYNNSVLPIPILSSIIKFRRFLSAGKMGAHLIKEKFGEPDVSHVHVLARTFLLAKKFTAPLIISEQWSGYLPEDGMYKGVLKKWLTRKAIRQAKAVTTVSESLKRAMLEHGLKNNYTVIPNVVDTTLFKPAAEKSVREKTIFLHVSNLDDRAKNVSGMIRSMKKVSESKSNFEFHIVGDGPEREALEKLTQDLDMLNNKVQFLGTKMPDEVARLMQGSDYFLLFSNYDNMPCVMVEAMACGLPVIGSNVHGIGEHVKEGRGIIVKANDVHAFASAIIQVMEKGNILEPQSISEYARTRFSYKAVAEQFDKIYQSIVK